MDKPLIFITNDDGVNAPGLRAVVNVARKFGRVLVIAPETTQSGKAHAITMYTPLHLRLVEKSEDLTIYACTGTPVDCVKMAFDHVLGTERPALSISGINHGSNSAVNVLYSGTMGAAIESSFYGAPSIGLSLDDHTMEADFTASAAFAEKIIPQFLSVCIDEPLCLNINIPKCKPEEIKGHRVCRQNKGFWKEEFYCRQDPHGRDYFWLTGFFDNAEPDATDTDEWAIANGYISIVPIQIDMTNYEQMSRLENFLR